MNNLHRELAPSSASAWGQIEEEATRTLKHHLAARRVVDAIGSKAISTLRQAGCNGPYAPVPGAEACTAASGGGDEGYPLLHHIERVVDGGITWARAIEGGFVPTTRGGDFELDIGQDLSVGYLSHSSMMVELYLLETVTFRVLTSEAAVVLAPVSP